MEETIVLYPAPGIGHMISMLELAKLILPRHKPNFSAVHILITTGFRDINSNYLHHISTNNPSIIFHHFPFIQPNFSPNRSMAATVFEFIRLNYPNARNSLQEISRKSRIRAFIIDFFCTSALPCAEELRIPTYYFFTSGLAALAAYLYFPTIHDKIDQSFKDLPQIEIRIPGLSTIPAIHMPEPVLIRDDPAYDDTLYFSVHLPKSSGILVNTFDELEPVPMKAITDGLCVPNGPTTSIYNIGPLIAGVESRPAENGNDGSEHTGQNECLSWLDGQPSRSVVFLCFGSRGSFTAEQLKEIAKGLESSGQRFLWVVKKPLDYDLISKQVHQVTDFELENAMPEGFLDRTKGKGLVIKSWAPQLQVLKFLTSSPPQELCKVYNNVNVMFLVLSMAAGAETWCSRWICDSLWLELEFGSHVPMVAWPLHAEQHINRVALVHDMKLAVDLEHGDGGFVSAEEIERKIRELMDSANGRDFRDRSTKMRDMALAALGDSGSSTAALAKLVRIWLDS